MSNHPTLSPATNYFFWRLCVWAGPVYLIGSLVSWALIAGYVPPPREDWTVLQITQFYTDNSLRIRAGLALALVFQPLYVILSVAASRVMQRVEGQGGILSMVEVLCSLMVWVIIVVGLLMWLTASFRPELRTPTEIMLLSDLGWLALDVPFAANTLQYCAFATVFLMDKRETPLIPGWVCWLSYALSALYICVALIPFFQRGPFSWHGLINFWMVIGGFFVWVMPVSYYLLKAVSRLEREEASVQ